MRIREVDLRINRNNFLHGRDTANLELKRRIALAWKRYNTSTDDAVIAAAYAEWGALADELYALEFQQ